MQRKAENSLTSCERHSILIPSKYRIITDIINRHERVEFSLLLQYLESQNEFINIGILITCYYV